MPEIEEVSFRKMAGVFSLSVDFEVDAIDVVASPAGFYRAVGGKK